MQRVLPTQMELTAPVRVYLASFLVSEGLLPTKAFLETVLLTRRSTQAHGPTGHSAAGSEVTVNDFKYVLSQVDTERKRPLSC